MNGWAPRGVTRLGRAAQDVVPEETGEPTPIDTPPFWTGAAAWLRARARHRDLRSPAPAPAPRRPLAVRGMDAPLPAQFLF
jgi:hypothetical protein